LGSSQSAGLHRASPHPKGAALESAIARHVLIDVENDKCGLPYERLCGIAEVLERARGTARWRGAYRPTVTTRPAEDQILLRQPAARRPHPWQPGVSIRCLEPGTPAVRNLLKEGYPDE
jgi:hypothetical protein